MNSAIFAVCLPAGIPALFLSFKLVEKKFLGTLFNKSLALLFAVSGKIDTQYIENIIVLKH